MKTETLFAARPDGRVAYDTMGSSAGAPLVCAPSLGDTRGEFRKLAPRLLERGYRVLTQDLRGHGESDASFARYDAQSLADETIAVLDQAGIERAVLVGCSVSGGAAIVAAAQHPERVAGLVLLAPFTGKIRGEALLGWLMGALFAGPWAASVWGAYYRSLYKRTAPDDLDAHIDSLRAMLREPARRRALVQTIRGSKKIVEDHRSLVRAPVEIVMGGADPDFGDPAAEGQTLADAIGARARCTTLEGLGHYPHVENPEAVLARIDALARVIDATPSEQASHP